MRLSLPGVAAENVWLMRLHCLPRSLSKDLSPLFHCALVLPFSSEDDAKSWCEIHGHPSGEVVPIRKVAHSARLWYGTYANTDWRKWTVSQAQEIFRTAELTSAFWRLEGDGTY
jgi:hypothetical protein